MNDTPNDKDKEFDTGQLLNQGTSTEDLYDSTESCDKKVADETRSEAKDNKAASIGMLDWKIRSRKYICSPQYYRRVDCCHDISKTFSALACGTVAIACCFSLIQYKVGWIAVLSLAASLLAAYVLFKVAAFKIPNETKFTSNKEVATQTDWQDAILNAEEEEYWGAKVIEPGAAGEDMKAAQWATYMRNYDMRNDDYVKKCEDGERDYIYASLTGQCVAAALLIGVCVTCAVYNSDYLVLCILSGISLLLLAPALISSCFALSLTDMKIEERDISTQITDKKLGIDNNNVVDSHLENVKSQPTVLPEKGVSVAS